MADDFKHEYNLEERCAVFGEDIIDLTKGLSSSPQNRKITEQLIASSGSIGANYCEATEAESKKDFLHKVTVSKKEIKETKHWLRLLARANGEEKNKIRRLWREAHELLLIFAKIIHTGKSRK